MKNKLLGFLQKKKQSLCQYQYIRSMQGRSIPESSASKESPKLKLIRNSVGFKRVACHDFIEFV